MRIIQKLRSLTDWSDEGDVEDSFSATNREQSAIERISSGHDGVPDSVNGYELDMNSSINVRWKNGNWEVECSHTGDEWRTKVIEGEETVVVGRYAERSKAVEAAEAVMSGETGRIPEESHEGATEEGDASEVGEEETEDDGQRKSEFEKEIESILEDVDAESVEEVNEAFGD